MSRMMERYIRNETERRRVEATTALAARFADRAALHDRDGSFPHENFAELREAGYLCLTVPQDYGGDEISLYEMVMLQEILAYGDGSTSLAAGWHMGLVLHLRTARKWPEPIFRELCRDIVKHGAMINTFASEPASGSPSRGGRPETTAGRAEGGWRISGRKTFSTLSPLLDRFVVTAYVQEEGKTADFLVRDLSGVRIEETWNTLGMRATGSHDVVLDRVWVPDEARLDRKQLEHDDGGGWLLHIPACYSGIAMAARDFILKFAAAYRPGSLPGPIAELEEVKRKIGLIEAELRTMRNLLYHTAERWDMNPGIRPEMRPDLGLAKHAVTNGAVRILDLAMRIAGGAGLSRNFPLERYYRDVRAGLHNPPMDDQVLKLLASEALEESEVASGRPHHL